MTAPGQPGSVRQSWLLRYRRWWWLVPGAAGVAMTLLIMVVLPPDRTIDNIGEVFYKVSPLVLAVFAIAGFPRRPGLGMMLLGLLVIGYMGIIDTLNILHLFDFAEAPDPATAFPALYQFTIFMNAFTVVAVLFGYRLGGASTARTFKVGVAAVLLVLAGLNDLSFYYLHDWPQGTPERLEWASHISVFVGGPATPAVAIGFSLVHIALAVVVLALPVQRWLDRLTGRPTRNGSPRSGAAPGGSTRDETGQDRAGRAAAEAGQDSASVT